MRTSIFLITLVAACGDNAGTGGNAPVLWLALDGRETEVKLAEEEPEPF